MSFEDFLKKSMNVPKIRPLSTDEIHALGKADLNAIYGMPKEEPTPEVKKEPEEWVWVDGYKATEANMTCKDYQYELDKFYEMPEKDIKECQSGFHFCLNLKDVFGYYPIGKGYRYFKVTALVRKKDYEEYTKPLITNVVHHSYGWAYPSVLNPMRNKLVAKQIRFLSELSTDEVFAHTEHADWSEERKKLAMEKSIKYVENLELEGNLIELGYSRPFAAYLVREGKYEVAYAVGSQKDLSMDMKCLMIFEG